MENLNFYQMANEPSTVENLSVYFLTNAGKFLYVTDTGQKLYFNCAAGATCNNSSDFVEWAKIRSIPKEVALSLFSFATGIATKALGKGSHAEGIGSEAIGDGSHAEGGIIASGGDEEGGISKIDGANDGTISKPKYVTKAGGKGSHAEGIDTRTGIFEGSKPNDKYTGGGYAAHAEGYGTVASGDYSHAEGKQNIVTGKASFGGGILNLVKGIANFTHGVSNHVAGKYNAIFGVNHVVGDGNSESNLVAGQQNYITGFSNAVFGAYNRIRNYSNLVTGQRNDAFGKLSIVGGYRNHSKTSRSIVTGKRIQPEYDDSIAYGNNGVTLNTVNIHKNQTELISVSKRVAAYNSELAFSIKYNSYSTVYAKFDIVGYDVNHQSPILLEFIFLRSVVGSTGAGTDSNISTVNKLEGTAINIRTQYNSNTDSLDIFIESSVLVTFTLSGKVITSQTT